MVEQEIKEVNLEEDIDEEFDEVPEEKPLAEEVKITKPEDIPRNASDESKYDSILNENPEMKNYLEYMWLKQKALSGKPLTPEEQQLKNDYDSMIQKEQTTSKEAEEQAQREAKRQADLQKQILMEYAETKQKEPSKIVSAREKELTLTGGESIPKLLKFIFAMKKARKKGGKVLIQVFRSRKVLVKWTANDVSFVEFYTTDEKGNELMEITRFSEYPYSFEGTPIPVLFAVQGYAEGFDFFSEFRKDLSSEMVSRLITRSFHAGYLKGAEVAQPNQKKGMFEGLMQFTPIIMIVGFLVMGYLLYSMYQDNTAMLTAISEIKTQMASRVIDANALIVR
jgi:hypothetical protein